MSYILTLIIVLVMLALVCLVIIFFHNQSKKQKASLLTNRFAAVAGMYQVSPSVTDKLVKGMLGLDYSAGKLVILQHAAESILDISRLQRCRKIKKWLHIPAGNGNQQPETHLEKIILVCDTTQQTDPVELVFYEYRHNSIFQMHELDQQANYWEVLINQQIKHHEKQPA